MISSHLSNDSNKWILHLSKDISEWILHLSKVLQIANIHLSSHLTKYSGKILRIFFGCFPI
jgi:hypothetical protein